MSDILVVDLVKAFYLDAASETDSARRAQLEADARAFEDIWRRSKYSLAPTRDQITAVVGSTALNIAERLDSILNISQDTHQLAQGLHLAQTEQGAAVVELRAEFHSLGESLDQRLTGLETRMDNSEDDRAGLREQLVGLKEAVARIEAFLDPDMTPEKAKAERDKFLGMLLDHDAILRRLVGEQASEAGG